MGAVRICDRKRAPNNNRYRKGEKIPFTIITKF